MRHELTEREETIQRLEAEVDALNAREAVGGVGRVTAGAGRSRAKGAERFVPKGGEADDSETAEEAASRAHLPILKLSPDSPSPLGAGAGDDDDETPEENPVAIERRPSPGSEGESVVDSSQESMHFYYRALEQLKLRQFDEVLLSITDFLNATPDHVYADRARYLVAQAHIGGHEWGLALAACNLLEAKYPHSFRVPDSLLLKAKALLGIGDTEAGRQALRDVIRRYPRSGLAREAIDRLSELPADPSLTSAKGRVPLLHEVN